MLYNDGGTSEYIVGIYHHPLMDKRISNTYRSVLLIVGCMGQIDPASRTGEATL
jgi:hypothetical protein